MIIQVPSKTFLCGEYAVLRGGTGWVICTQPSMTLQTGMNQQSKFFHPDSPAGRFLSQSVACKNTDPQGTRTTLANEFVMSTTGNDDLMGFGTSTAELLAVATLWEHFDRNKPSESTFNIQRLWKLWEWYQKEFKGRLSGVDFLAQYTGKCAQVQTKVRALQSFDWPWTEYGFLLFKNYIKVPTHIAMTGDQFFSDSIQSQSEDIIKNIGDAFQNNKELEFKTSLFQWADFLEAQGKIDASVVELRQNFQRKFPESVFKGCGALGIDVFMVLGPVDRFDEYKVYLQSFVCVASQLQLLGGLKFDQRDDSEVVTCH